MRLEDLILAYIYVSGKAPSRRHIALALFIAKKHKMLDRYSQ